MEDKVERILSEVQRMSSRFSAFESRLNQLERKMDELYRELGAQNGRELYRQINELHTLLKRFEQQLYGLVSDSNAVRRNSDMSMGSLEQIKQALAVIYKNTDELEFNIVGPDRETK